MLFRVNMHEFHVSFPLQLELLKQLSDILKHGGNSQVARMQAGIQLKNALYSKDPNLRFQYIQRWLAFPEDVRLYVKKNVSEQLTTSGFMVCSHCPTPTPRPTPMQLGLKRIVSVSVPASVKVRSVSVSGSVNTP